MRNSPRYYLPRRLYYSIRWNGISAGTCSGSSGVKVKATAEAGGIARAEVRGMVLAVVQIEAPVMARVAVRTEAPGMARVAVRIEALGWTGLYRSSGEYTLT